MQVACIGFKKKTEAFRYVSIKYASLYFSMAENINLQQISIIIISIELLNKLSSGLAANNWLQMELLVVC